MKDLTITIVGSRTITKSTPLFPVHDLIHAAICSIEQETNRKVTHFVGGGARGVDTIGEEICKSLGMNITIHKPDWEQHGKAAGFIRNNLLIRDADYVIAIWDGKSRGTLDSILKAKKVNKLFTVIQPEE